MDIKYKLEFFSYWHCGSGLSAGADVDQLVVKDNNGLPFVPGKTIKGLIREAAEELSRLNPDKYASKHDLVEVFGKIPDVDSLEATPSQGCAFFSNAEFPEGDKAEIIKKELPKFLFERITSTAIEKTGIAKDTSLRKMEVALPCTLTGMICGLPEKTETTIVDALKFIKRLGENRNRGLGRCVFTVIKN